MLGVPEGSDAATAAGSAAGAGAAAVAVSAGLSLGWHATSAASENTIAEDLNNDFASIAALLDRGPALLQTSKQLVGLEIALEIPVAVVTAGIFDEIPGGPQPVLRGGHEFLGRARQIRLRDL